MIANPSQTSNSLVISQKGEIKNGCYKKAKHAEKNFPKKEHLACFVFL